MPLSFQIVALGSQLIMMAADRPPCFDMVATCRLNITAVYGVLGLTIWSVCRMSRARYASYRGGG